MSWPSFFNVGGRYNSWISHKLIFHVVIPHEFQYRRKMMKNCWLLIHLSIPNECHEIQKFGSFPPVFLTLEPGFSKSLTKVLHLLSVTHSPVGGRPHKSMSRPPVGIWTNPFGVRSIGKRFRKFYRWNRFVTTPVPFYSNFPRKSRFWWSRQGDDKCSQFEASRRSGAMIRCGKRSGTWSEVV